MPSSIELSGMEVSLVNTISRETVLKEYLESVKRDYDFVLLDCSPSLGMLTINAMAAADTLLIPVQASYLPAKSPAADQSQAEDRGNPSDHGRRQDKRCKRDQRADPECLWRKDQGLRYRDPPFCPGFGDQQGRNQYFYTIPEGK